MNSVNLFPWQKFPNFIPHMVMRKIRYYKAAELQELADNIREFPKQDTKKTNLHFLTNLQAENPRQFYSKYDVRPISNDLEDKIKNLPSAIEKLNTEDLQKELLKLESRIAPRKFKYFLRCHGVSKMWHENMSYKQNLEDILSKFSRHECLVLFEKFSLNLRDLSTFAPDWGDLPKDLGYFIVSQAHPSFFFGKPDLNYHYKVKNLFNQMNGAQKITDLLQEVRTYSRDLINYQLPNLIHYVRNHTLTQLVNGFGKKEVNDTEQAILTILYAATPLKHQMFYKYLKDKYWRIFYKRVKTVIKNLTIEVISIEVEQTRFQCQINIIDNYRTGYHGYTCYSEEMKFDFDATRKAGKKIQAQCTCKKGRNGFCQHLFVIAQYFIEYGLLKEDDWTPIPIKSEFSNIREKWMDLPPLRMMVSQISKMDHHNLIKDSKRVQLAADKELHLNHLTPREKRLFEQANTLDVNEVYHFEIVGIFYTGNGPYINSLSPKTQLDLHLELKNSYDPFAVSVWHRNTKLGYIPKNENIPIFKALLNKTINLKCFFGTYIPSEHEIPNWSESQFQPQRASITVHTFSQETEWETIN